MSRQGFSEALNWATAAATAIANNATEQLLVPNQTIFANYLADGRVLRWRAMGGYGTTATPTLTFSVRWGGLAGTVLAKSFAATTTSAVGGGASMTAYWEAEILIQTRLNGSSGSLFTGGNFTLYTSTAPAAGTVTNYGLVVPIVSGSTGGTTPAAVTVDLTADTQLSFTVTWSAANAANSIQTQFALTESLN